MREIYKSLTGETLTKLSPHCETSTPFDETLRALLRVSDTPVTCNDSQLPKVTAKGFAKVDLKWLSSEVKSRGREGGCFPRLLRSNSRKSFARVVVRLWTACGVSYIYFVQLEFSIYYLYTTALCNSGKVHFVPERLKASRDKFMSLALV